MPTYRYTGDSSFSHEGEELSAGDEIELSEYAYRLHDAYFEPADGEDDSDDESSESDPEADAAGADDAEAVDSPFDPSEKTNSELESDLEENDYSEAELQALLAAEESGKNRDGAKDAINDRLDNAED